MHCRRNLFCSSLANSSLVALPYREHITPAENKKCFSSIRFLPTSSLEQLLHSSSSLFVALAESPTSPEACLRKVLLKGTFSRVASYKLHHTSHKQGWLLLAHWLARCEMSLIDSLEVLSMQREAASIHNYILP